MLLLLPLAMYMAYRSKRRGQCRIFFAVLIAGLFAIGIAQAELHLVWQSFTHGSDSDTYLRASAEAYGQGIREWLQIHREEAWISARVGYYVILWLLRVASLGSDWWTALSASLLNVLATAWLISRLAEISRLGESGLSGRPRGLLILLCSGALWWSVVRIVRDPIIVALVGSSLMDGLHFLNRRDLRRLIAAGTGGLVLFFLRPQFVPVLVTAALFGGMIGRLRIAERYVTMLAVAITAVTLFIGPEVLGYTSFSGNMPSREVRLVSFAKYFYGRLPARVLALQVRDEPVRTAFVGNFLALLEDVYRDVFQLPLLLLALLAAVRGQRPVKTLRDQFAWAALVVGLLTAAIYSFAYEGVGDARILMSVDVMIAAFIITRRGSLLPTRLSLGIGCLLTSLGVLF